MEGRGQTGEGSDVSGPHLDGSGFHHGGRRLGYVPVAREVRVRAWRGEGSESEGVLWRGK